MKFIVNITYEPDVSYGEVEWRWSAVARNDKPPHHPKYVSHGFDGKATFATREDAVEDADNIIPLYLAALKKNNLETKEYEV